MKTYLYLVSGACALLTAGCVGAPQAVAEPGIPVAVAPSGPPPPPPPPDSGQQVVASTADAQPAQPAGAATENAPVVGSMDELVAPIALYPDALVALILPASTASSDVVLAARYLDAGGDPKEVDSRSWDDSVKALAHYPDVVKWMDENLAWTQRLGQAYLNQPQEVMAAIQRDRSRAQANGALKNTPQQDVVVDQGSIRIIPAQPDVIYVPRYDPEIVYVEQPVYVSPDPWITFGIGFGVGSWLAYDCDWHSHSIWIDAHRREHWREHRDWRYPHFPDRPGFVHEQPGWHRWAPPPGRRPPHSREWADGRVIRPTPMPGTPRFDRRDRDDRGRGPGNHAGEPNRPGQFRPGPRVPRPIDAPANTAMRPDRAAPTRPVAPAPGNQNRWIGERRDRGNNQPRNNGQAFVPGSRVPVPVATTPSAPAPQANRDVFGRERSAPRRFVPPAGESRPIAGPARVTPAPHFQQPARVVEQPQPRFVAPRTEQRIVTPRTEQRVIAPSAPPPQQPARVVAPAASQQVHVTPGARVPRVERQQERGRNDDRR